MPPRCNASVPIKVQVKGEAIFVCCENCVKVAKDEPAKTLACVKNHAAQAPEASK
jgi:hypothetical protein